MIQIIVLTHGNLAQELVSSVELMLGKQENLHFVEETDPDSLEELQLKLKTLLSRVNSGDGFLIFTDLFGGTPCNAASMMCKSFDIEIVTGVNLPMLLSTIFASKSYHNAEELAAKAISDGQKSIIDVKKMLLSKMK
jgi:PTS system mannose-specific IIA component